MFDTPNSIEETNSITELSLDEVGEISGAPLPLIPIAYFGIGVSTGVLAGGAAFIGGLEAARWIRMH
jgi:hypothetical protein